MKIAQVFALISLVSVSSFALTDDLPTSPLLKKLTEVKVSSRGEILKQTHRHPFTHFVVAIPVTIQVPNVCTEFVGQENLPGATPKHPVTLVAMGASNPLADACIALLAEPVKTQLTYNIDVLTGGFVAADPIQRRLVIIHGAGAFNVTLDMSKETVQFVKH